jgi:hypothetical protein
LRFALLEVAKARARYGEIERLLAERRRIIEEYEKKGVIDGTSNGVRSGT